MPSAQHAAAAQAGPEDAGGHAGRAGVAQGRGRRGVGRRRDGQGAGHRRPGIKSITIDPQAVDPEDVELLQDMVLAAVNEGLRSAQELAAVEDGRDRRRARRPRAASGWPRLQPADRRAACTPRPVQRLITELSKLPGVGGRTAQRLAFHILRAPDEEALALADAIREVKERIGLCEVCFNLADGPRCRICADERRDPELICVVEEPSDVISIERTHEFARPLPRARRRAVADRRGRPRGPEDRRALRAGRKPTDPSARWSSPPTRRRPARPPRCTSPPGCASGIPESSVTRLASGLPVGADLEYADELTLGGAFSGRRAV